MAKASESARRAKQGILIAGIFVLLVMIFGAGRQVVARQYLMATAGNSAQTELVEVAKNRSSTFEVVTQLQYTQRALYKAEVLTDSGEVLGEVSQDVTSRNNSSFREVAIANWPDPKAVRVRLTVASQSITAAPPAGARPEDAPVIFEVNFYKRWLHRSYLWPALLACIVLWLVVDRASKREDTWTET